MIKRLAMYAGVLIVNAAPLFAATDVREADNSDLFVWIFLAFCGLIVVAQLIPAIMILLGVAKSVKNKKPETAPVMDDQETIQGA
ncbi:MAG: hypothetical protein L7F78_18355 [Syntrophales bacterium LBB04]|nr:hypothetical protein [Syntrophales bacterium LBB04]